MQNDPRSLPEVKEPQHRVYRGSMYPEKIKNKRPKALGMGTSRTRYYQPGQLDLEDSNGSMRWTMNETIARNYSRVAKPEIPMGRGDGNTTGAAYLPFSTPHTTSQAGVGL